MITILAQIISILAAAFNIFSYQMKDNRRLFLSKGISGALFAVNFILLGNFTAGALNAVNLPRGAVLAGGEKWHKKRWLFLVQGLYLLCCVVTFGKSRTMIGGAVFAMVVSLLATASQLIETAILWGNNGRHIRLAQISFISPFWLFNNIVTGSIGGIVTEIFGMCSVIISFLRFGWNGFLDDAGKKQEEKTE